MHILGLKSLNTKEITGIEFIVKKWLLISNLSLIITFSVQAENKIAIANMDSLFRQVAQKNKIYEKLEVEFKGRTDELQNIERDLQNKVQRLQNNSSTMRMNERNKLEQDIISQREIFSKKIQNFEQNRQCRSDEERNKLISCIQFAAKKVAVNKNIDLVIDSSSIVFNNDHIEDITTNIFKQVK